MKLLRPSVMRKSEWNKNRDQSQWKQIKTQVLNRDRFTCVYCRFSCSTFMQVNHIGAEDDHSLENLETVCRACHSVLHMGISCMNDTMSVFECKPEVSNIAPIVCITRLLIAKNIPWLVIEEQILERFGLLGGKQYNPLQSTGWANKLLHGIAPSDFRGYLPEGLAVMFHEEGEWHNYPETTWKWQCVPGAGYRKEKTGKTVSERIANVGVKGEEEEITTQEPTIQEMLEAALKQVEMPAQKLTVTLKGKQSNGDGRPMRNRVIHITLSGKEAKDFQTHPTLDALWSAFGVDLGDGVSDDGKQSILIETITLAREPK